MTRLKVFEDFERHAWYGKIFSRLSQADIIFCKSFIEQNEHLSDSDFEMKAHRLFLDSAKPKNYFLIMELLATTKTRYP